MAASTAASWRSCVAPQMVWDKATNQMSQKPRDPALNYEVGKYLIELGRPDDGERWMLTALTLDPDYQPAIKGLADYYEGAFKAVA